MKRNQKLLVVRTMMIIVLIFSLFPFSSVLAEQNIGNSSIPDDISDRTLTIWKYQVKDISELGGNGDGLAKTIDKTPLPGIKFSIEKVVAKDGAKFNDPTVDKDYDLVNDSEGNPIRSVVITGDDGSAKHLFGTGKEADGIYLVTELPDDRPGTGPKVVQPVPPFFVNVPMTHRTEKDKLIYDIEVQPKNILESIIEPTKTIEDETAFSNKAGAIFDWEATANVPFGLYQVPAKDAVITPVYDREGSVVADLEVKKGVPYYANYLEFHDTLDAKLVLDDVVLQAGTVSNKNSWTNLEFDVDYTVSVDGKVATSAPVTSTTKKAKVVIVSLTETGMKKIHDNRLEAPQMRVVYTTHTDKDFSGVIANAFTLEYLTPGQKPLKVNTAQPKDLANPDAIDESYPKYYTGGFKLLKTDEEDKELTGAEFHLAMSKENGEKKMFLATDGRSYEYGSTLPAKVNWVKAQSGADGVATFNGLELDVSKDKKEDIKRSYWIVETKAPAGYELLSEPKEVVVNLATSSSSPAITIINKSQTVLPFTGGDGTTLIIAIALGAITIGAIVIVYDKRRQNA